MALRKWTPDLTGTPILDTIFDAKGDLITATADDTSAILSVGADGEFLVPKTANSNGLEWVGIVTYAGLVLTKDGNVVYK